MWLILNIALAAGHYHPQEIAEHSEAYASATEVAAATFQDRNRTGERLAAALRDYETSVNLLGSRALAADRERYASLEASFREDKLALEGFANTLMVDYDKAFLAAMERALSDHPDAVSCLSELPAGRTLPGMPARTKPNPECTGEDLNPTIAQAMDEDEVLLSALAKLNEREWPEWTVPEEPMPTVGEGPWVEVVAFFREGADDALDDIDRADEEARIPILADAEQGADPDTLKKRALEVTALTASRRAELAEPVLDAVETWSKKQEKRGRATMSWCASPELFGGCEGDQASPEQIRALLDERRVSRVLP